MPRVRLRGIYSSALTKLLLDSGFQIVQPSEKIVHRFGLSPDYSPCEATVLDGDFGEIVIMGIPEVAESIYRVVASAVKYFAVEKSVIGIGEVRVGKVVDKHGDECVVDIGDGLTGRLQRCGKNPGDIVLVSALKPAFRRDRIDLTTNFRIRGLFIDLIHGAPRITFSEHIKDRETRAKLSTIAVGRLAGSGLGIHFRSSSKYARREEIEREIDELLVKYREILSEFKDATEPRLLTKGESIYILRLNYLSRSILDEYRRSIAPTLPGHHSFKAWGWSDYVDLLEILLEKLESQGFESEVQTSFLEYLVGKLRSSRTVEILHLKPSGEAVRLAESNLLHHRVEKGCVDFVLERTLSTQGIYDGLGIPKRPGDKDIMRASTCSPYVVHNYFREGSWIGSYINIGTPVEIYPNGIAYMDLYVDVVLTSTRGPEIIDMDELEKSFENGLISPSLYEYARRASEEALKRVDQLVFKTDSPSHYLET